MRYVIAFAGVAVGVLGVSAGEADDSPGLQLLGVLIALGALVFLVRAGRNRSRS